MSKYNIANEFLENLAYDEDSPDVNKRLTNHNKIMKKQIFRTEENVYTANGYAGSNPVMVVGDDGIVIIDPCETIEAMETIMKEFRKIANFPVKGIIYSHHHQDHWGGAAACISKEDYETGKVTIIAHELFEQYVSELNGELIDIRYGRGIFMFGQMLERGVNGRTSVGNGPQLMSGTWSLFKPTITFRDTLDIEIAGIKMHLFHVPSEAEDEIATYLVDDDILHVAEVLQGECFPNIYTIRGTNRSASQWITAVDRLRQYNVGAIVGAHIRPLVGKEEVKSLLIDYRDSIQYVRDQTIRLLNEGHTPDYIVDHIQLPPHLYHRDRIGEFYGTIKQEARRVYDEYVGWFNGEPSKLDPIPLVDRAKKYVDALGGREKIIKTAREAIENGDYKWAMDILTYVITLDPLDIEARKVKANALRKQGYLTENATWRNWYMTSAYFLEGKFDMLKGTKYGEYLSNKVFINGLETVPAKYLFQDYAAKLNGERASKVNMVMSFNIEDCEHTVCCEIRQGILDMVLPNKSKNLGVVKANKKTFIKIMTKDLTPSTAIREGIIKTDIDPHVVDRFFSYFDGYTPFMDMKFLYE